MILSVVLSFLSFAVFAIGHPTLEGGYGYGGGFQDSEGHGGAVNKHGVHGQRHGGKVAKEYGSSYGDEDAAKLLYRGEQDKHRQHSDRNRALLSRNRNRLAGDSYRNKAKVDDGFSNVYHKEEYSKNNRFYDTDRDNKLQQNFNDYSNLFGDVDGRYYDDGKEGSAAVRASGRHGDLYGKRFYDDGEADYASIDHGKQLEGHGGGYARGGGGAQYY